MAVQYYNGQYYNAPEANTGLLSIAWNDRLRNQLKNEAANPQVDYSKNVGYINPISAPTQQASAPQYQNTGMNGNPFSTATSGGVSGTLQPYVNRMTQNANNALYGGLLNYQPQPIVAGDAGGTPVNSTPPKGFSLEGGLLNGANFGNRSWMNK
jgi:hypothetical protein